MAGFTLSTIRAAIGAQLAANIDKGTNIDVDGKRSPAPAVRLVMDETPNFFGTFGPDGVCRCRFRLTIDPAGNDQAAVRRLDQYLSVGTGNSWSVVDALKVDDTFGGAVSGLEVAPGDYDAENVTADLLLTFIAMKQNAEV